MTLSEIEVERVYFLRGGVDVIEDGVVMRPHEPIGDGNGPELRSWREIWCSHRIERSFVRSDFICKLWSFGAYVKCTTIYCRDLSSYLSIQ